MDKQVDFASAPGSPESGDRDDPLASMVSLYDPYGWLAKIGLIVPASNTINAHEWGMLAPPGVSIHTARVSQSGRSSLSSFQDMAAATPLAAEQLATAAVDVIAYGCTSGSFTTPRREIMDRISRVGGCPATNSADAVVAALRALGAGRVALVTPYMDYVHEREIDFLQEEGIEVVASKNLGLGETERERFAIRNVPPEAVLRMALEVDRPEAEAVFVSCTSLASAAIIPSLEQHLGKPVVTSNQATLWHAFRLLKLNVAVPAGGRLLGGDVK